MQLMLRSTALLLVLAACQEPGGPNPQSGLTGQASPKPANSVLERIARIRAEDAQTAAHIAQEGELLYETTGRKLSATEYCSLAFQLATEGEFRRAIRAASMALYLGERAGNEYHQGLAHKDLAYANLLAGDLHKAKEHAESALALVPRVRREGRADLAYRAHRTLGDVAARQGIFSEALKQYDLAANAASGFRQDRERAKAHVHLATANAALGAGKLDLAEEFLARAEGNVSDGFLPIVSRTRAEIALGKGDMETARRLFAQSADSASDDQVYNRVLASYGEARALRALGDDAGAEARLFTALASAEQMRARFRSEEISSGAFGSVQNVFDEAIDLAMARGNVGPALEASERSRSRAALDLIRERVSQQGAAGTERVSALPVYAVAQNNADTAALSELKKAVPSGSVAAVYHLTDRGLYVWTVRNGAVQGSRVDVDPREVRRASLEYRQSMRGGRPVTPAGRMLAEKLIEPLRLQAGEHVVIVPHGPLHYLPFHAFQTAGSFVIQRNSVSYAPSLSVLLGVSRRPLGRGGELIAFGNPVIDIPNSALPGAEEEVRAIVASATPGALQKLGRDASEASFVREAPGFRSVHVAAHAKVDELDPLYSTIFLAPDGGYDGMLEAHEIYNIDLSGSDLVTLSACETGLGRVGRGDEQWGFVRTFLASGARSAVVSFWEVPDDATKVLMERFYAEMRGGRSRSAALREAQVHLATATPYTDPVNWAAFTIWGASD